MIIIFIISVKPQTKEKQKAFRSMWFNVSRQNHLSYNIQMMTFTMATGETFERNFMIFLILYHQSNNI
jgi:hypothetical protein